MTTEIGSNQRSTRHLEQAHYTVESTVLDTVGASSWKELYSNINARIDFLFIKNSICDLQNSSPRTYYFQDNSLKNIIQQLKHMLDSIFFTIIIVINMGSNYGGCFIVNFLQIRYL